ncbi:TolC family protein [Massilia sp. DJPM01]|uniref:TolC family protein n=1 Tax=Massilia sp. DJPM01 TaxID=3024404 RepID=UPI00259E1A68|nr:TolC family protein [Massilia sp. DJPM01]MDM5181340.1 TolC family protein [Massilia sp. DJPM01]
MHVFRLRALLIGALVVTPFIIPCVAGAVGTSPRITLHDLVEQAWQRSSPGRSQPSREAEVQANRELSSSWLAGQPVLGLSQRSDRFGSDRGLSESEVSVATSLWMPGQRAARRTLAEQTTREVHANTRKSRLEVAGEVRARLWDAAAAQAQLEEKQGHLHHTEELAGEVQRRVAAGDLARVDGLLAEQEMLAGRVAVEQAKAEVQQSASKLKVLTGYAGPLPLAPEPLPSQPGANNPRREAARATEQRAQAALGLARASRRAPPTVTLSMRRERNIGMSTPDRSLGLAVQIPIGGAGRNRPVEAQAQTQIAVAAAEAEQIEAATTADLEVARTTLDNAKSALDSARARVAAMTEHHRLIERAFKLGERGLADLLRSTALAHEAEVAERQQEIALARAHAQLNQASGVLP